MNQPHPPQKKNKDIVDLNVRKRIFVKHNECSMLLAKNVPIQSAKVFVNSIRENAKRLGIQLATNLIVTQ